MRVQVATYLARPQEPAEAAGPGLSRDLAREALDLADRIATEFSLVPMIELDAWDFRALLQDAVASGFDFGEDDQPILGRHVDPVFNDISSSDFHGIVALKPGTRPKLIATNTARCYRASAPLTLRWLFETQRLWCDHPERDAPFAQVTVSGPPSSGILDELLPAAVHSGTAWARGHHRPGRRSALPALMAANPDTRSRRAKCCSRAKTSSRWSPTSAPQKGCFSRSSIRWKFPALLP